MRKFLCPLLFLLLILPGLAGQSREEIDWAYEIDLLSRELTGKHPNLFFRTDSTWFFHAMREVASRAPGHSVFEVSVMLQQVIAAMGDAQTQINYHFLIDKSLILPIEFYWFEDGIYLLETDKKAESLLGKKLSAINNFPLQVVIDSLSSLLVVDNYSVVKQGIHRMITWFQLLEYFGFASSQDLSLTVEGRSGEKETFTISLPVELGEMADLKPESMPLGWQDQSAYFWEKYFENEHLYYIQYNRCWSREVEEDYGSGASALFMPSFKEFEKQVLTVLKKNEIEKLVFDLRFNRGGNASQGTEFIRKMCKALPKETREIFVLVGRATFSSAIINTVDFMKCAEVVLVGEETSGRPNHFGEVNRFVLPESRLIVSYSTTWFKLLEEDLPSIEPRLLAPISFEQYMQGVDPALEAIRHYQLH
jgi:hypothetical protein